MFACHKGLVLGALNAFVALATLALVEALTPDEFGWFAYAPLNGVVVDDPRFPWQYVLLPLALLVANSWPYPWSSDGRSTGKGRGH